MSNPPASPRHCERSEAIHLSAYDVTMDCFASLAMTAENRRQPEPLARRLKDPAGPRIRLFPMTTQSFVDERL
ncbi:hypothetical protein V1279_005554 [Bradyrhizobium sp. AZCC 1610]